MTTMIQPALDERTVYLGDNGRAFCGSLHCAGATAYYTGRDLSGQPVLPCNGRMHEACIADGWVPRCEACRREAVR